MNYWYRIEATIPITMTVCAPSVAEAIEFLENDLADNPDQYDLPLIVDRVEEIDEPDDEHTLLEELPV